MISTNQLIVHYAKRSNQNIHEWEEKLHTHDHSEIFYITKGEGSFLVSGTTCQVKENDILLIAPGEEHTEISHHDNPLSYLVIGISGISLTRNTLYMTPFFLINDSSNQLLFYFQSCQHEFKRQQINSELIISYQTMMILLLLEREKKLRVSTFKEELVEKSITQAKTYIDSHYKEQIDLDLLATTFHISKFYLSHQFKKEFGFSPIKYLNQLRLNEAKKLLAFTDNSVTEIAELTGHTSHSYFTQRFKSETTLSPSEYRKKTRDN